MITIRDGWVTGHNLEMGCKNFNRKGNTLQF
jgi:hypothetical protein